LLPSTPAVVLCWAIRPPSGKNEAFKVPRVAGTARFTTTRNGGIIHQILLTARGLRQARTMASTTSIITAVLATVASAAIAISARAPYQTRLRVRQHR
jgi:hypothetical protein